MPKVEHESLAKVIVFDHITQNYDRTIANPNLMKLGDSISLIDHEETFVTATGEPADAEIVPTPWMINRAGFNLAGDKQHALWGSLGRGKSELMAMALSSWKQLSKRQINTIVGDMLDCWDKGPAEQIGDFLYEATERLDDVETSLRAMC